MKGKAGMENIENGDGSTAELVASLGRFFDNSSAPILFAGAGVSARVGALTWGPLLERLKEWIRSKDPLTANQMANRIYKQDLITAAEYFFLSPEVTDGERFSVLATNLDGFDANPLKPLMRLPFKGVVTTNFDRTLLDAYAAEHGKSIRDFRRGDESFKEVNWCTQAYVARIHGGVEFPPSIVLTSRQFEQLDQDDIYKNLLGDLFARKNVLFLGCSFTDPAVRAVFEQLNRLYGPTTPGRHMALIPTDIDGEFLSRLNRLNVESIRYDPSDRHKVLWDAIDSFSSSRSAQKQIDASEAKNVLPPFDAAKHYLASCYARVRMQSRIRPLREAVVEGMVSSIVQSHSPKGVSLKVVVDTIHRELGIHPDESSGLINAALESLSEEKLCRLHKDGESRKITWTGGECDQSGLDQAIESLVASAVDRAVVQEGLKPMQETKQALKGFFNDMVLQRGWDLGAAFAANRPPVEVDIGKLLYQSCVFLSHPEIDALTRVCVRMLVAPTEAEAVILAELGRASFALEMAIQCPRSTLFHAAVLPQRIYLDANVLMPAITFGHPYHNVYKQTIDRLREAAGKSAGNVQLIAYQGFLNEIVSHRKLAIEESELWGDDFREGVVKEAIFYGTINMNVFVGAFANVAQFEKEITFQEFLNKYAPYSSERELATFLRRHQIAVLDDGRMRSHEYPSISYELQKAYSNHLAAGKDVKLIEHDAVQLSALHADHLAGHRSILVTADKKLREALTKGKHKALAEFMVSNVGLTQLIDLLVGNSGNSRALASLMWTVTASSKTEEVRQYLVSLALREYDEAMAMAMPAVVEQIAENIVEEADRLGIKAQTGDAAERRKFFQFVGTFEDKYFMALREKIELRRQTGQ